MRENLSSKSRVIFGKVGMFVRVKHYFYVIKKIILVNKVSTEKVNPSLAGFTSKNLRKACSAVDGLFAKMSYLSRMRIFYLYSP